MKYCAACLTVLVLLLCVPGVSLAHRVNVFAFVGQDAVQVECSFSKSQKVRNGKLVITDLETGGKLLEGITDERGVFRFRPGNDFIKTGHGLNILLNAGEGHQNDWQIFAEELAAVSPAGQPAKPAVDQPDAEQPVAAKSAVEQQPGAEQPERAAAGGREQTGKGADAAELEALIGRVLDAKLVPIKQTLARQEDRGPGVRDIVGGIGWIIGLLGLAAYLKYRR